jgi:hypothetical protein
MTRVRGIDHEGSEEFEVTSCHCEEGMKVSDANLSCLGVSRRITLFGWCRPVDRHGLSALAMTSWRGSRDEKPGTIERRANRSVL